MELLAVREDGMPIYYFDCNDNGQCLFDSVGSELADDKRAQKEAMSALFEIVRSSAEIGRRKIEIKIRDSSGRIFYAVSLSFEGRSMD